MGNFNSLKKLQINRLGSQPQKLRYPMCNKIEFYLYWKNQTTVFTLNSII